jgi:hypothetical protein
MWLPVPVTGWRGMYFLSQTTGVRNVASPMIALVSGRNQSQDGNFKLYRTRLYCALVESSRWICARRCVFDSYRGTSVIYVVEPQCLIYVLRKLQRFLLTDFILYICMPGVFNAFEKDTTWRGYVMVLLFSSFRCGS